ncbi:cytochrome P450 4V2-like [Phymastichus coffea]|uniref:cytochrome P450 4V2-like n=1 Tax=Phymastichus coffea TaxID=108790 RepID=UPI00273C8A1E|nr:cytochrome P450 4V2-like [Phymastichus coffea]
MFLVLLLAENKEAQDKARKEIVDVLGGYGNLMTMEHIKEFEYLDRCAKESLRLFTTTPYIARSINKEIQLGQYTIPLGTEAYISLFDLHRNPDYWKDPLKFDPDRFLPENTKQQHPFAYVLFSKGPRSCIGQ